MKNMIIIPKGKFAADDDAALKARREALKQKLLAGGKITLKQDGAATDNQDGQGSTISIPKGKLAADDDAALKARREALKQKLLAGGKITLKQDGAATDNQDGQGSTINIPKGKLASKQWYESNPTLLKAEQAAMAKFFPAFKLYKLDDGRLYWTGELAPGVYETKFGKHRAYTVMAVYQNNHPVQKMGSSIYVYLIQPDIDDIIKEYGKCPHHLLRDSIGEVYLCTANAEDIKTGNTITTAASVLAWAVKWLLAYELVLTGELTKEEFDHGKI